MTSHCREGAQCTTDPWICPDGREAGMPSDFMSVRARLASSGEVMSGDGRALCCQWNTWARWDVQWQHPQQQEEQQGRAVPPWPVRAVMTTRTINCYEVLLQDVKFV
jgi:hypothetical protein